MPLVPPPGPAAYAGPGPILFGKFGPIRTSFGNQKWSMPGGPFYFCSYNLQVCHSVFQAFHAIQIWLPAVLMCKWRGLLQAIKNWSLISPGNITMQHNTSKPYRYTVHTSYQTRTIEISSMVQLWEQSLPPNYGTNNYNLCYIEKLQTLSVTL